MSSFTMKSGHEKCLVELIQNCFVLLFSLFRINEERTYIGKSVLKRHSSSVHVGKKQIKCYICNATFTQKASLGKHALSVHEGKKPFKYNICDSTFS